MNNIKIVPPLLRDIYKLASDQGWVVEKRGNQHLMWKSPFEDVPFVITSGTVNERKILQTILKDLTSRGFIASKEEWRQKSKRYAAIINKAKAFPPEEIKRVGVFVLDDKEILPSKAELPEDVWVAMGDAYAEWWLDHPTSEDFDSDRTRKNCLWCNRPYVDWIELYRHQRKCNRIPYKPPSDDELAFRAQGVEQKVEQRGGSYICPSPGCDAVMYRSELGEHALTEHRLVQCAECESWEPQETIDGHYMAEHNLTGAADVDISNELSARTVEAEVVEVHEAVTAVNDAADADDDADLWAALEAILGGSVPLTRTSMQAVELWMDVTRELLALKDE